MNTLRPRDSVCFLLVSFHFFYPNFKRPIPAQKWIFKQQAPPNIPMYEPLPSPRQSHSQNDPKTLLGPRPSLSAAPTVAPAEISCSTTAAWPSRAAKYNAVMPRHRRKALCSGNWPRAPRMRRGRRGCLGCRRETKRSNGMFLRVVGQNSEYPLCEALGRKREQSSPNQISSDLS